MEQIPAQEVRPRWKTAQQLSSEQIAIAIVPGLVVATGDEQPSSDRMPPVRLSPSPDAGAAPVSAGRRGGGVEKPFIRHGTSPMATLSESSLDEQSEPFRTDTAISPLRHGFSDSSSFRHEPGSSFTVSVEPVSVSTPHPDWLLVIAKCSVPAIFVALSGAIAIPVNRAIGDGEGAEFFQKASEEFAGGALIVTYALELSHGYVTKGESGQLSRKLVAATLIGTILSAQLQAFGQALFPFEFFDTDPDIPGDKDAGDAFPFALGFFVDGVVLAYERADRHAAERGPRSCWQRVRPVFTSVLAFVMSIDNFVGGFGMYNKLETELMPAWAYYVIFVVSIYLGGLATIGVQRIPSRAVQAFWYAFGAIAILVGGLELASDGLGTWVLLGFITVWIILFVGGGD